MMLIQFGGEIDKFSEGLICLSGGDENPINNLLEITNLKRQKIFASL